MPRLNQSQMALIKDHGAWVTPHCWDPFISYFEQQGYTCLAPTWPHKDKSIEELRRNPPAKLAGLGVQEIVDHYAAIVKAQEEPPILIGHSFGGLFTQILLDRGLGAAGVAIDPAAAKGVLALRCTPPSSKRSAACSAPGGDGARSCPGRLKRASRPLGLPSASRSSAWPMRRMVCRKRDASSSRTALLCSPSCRLSRSISRTQPVLPGWSSLGRRIRLCPTAW